MKLYICDNCGKDGGGEYRIGNLCEDCVKLWQIEYEKIEATMKVMRQELENKFHIRK